MNVWLWDGYKNGPVGLCKVLEKSDQLIKIRRPNGEVSIEFEENIFSTLNDLVKTHTSGRMLYSDIIMVNCSDLKENELLRQHLYLFQHVHNEGDLAKIQDQKYDDARVAYFMSHLTNAEFLGEDQHPYSWSFKDFMNVLLEANFLWDKKYRRLPSGKRMIIMDDTPSNFCKQFRASWSNYLYGKSDEFIGNSMLYHFQRLEIYPTWGDSFTKYLKRLKFSSIQELNDDEKIEKQHLFGE